MPTFVRSNEHTNHIPSRHGHAHLSGVGATDESVGLTDRNTAATGPLCHGPGSRSPESVKDDEPKLYLDIIRRSSARINYLICDLLKYQEADKAQGSQYSMHRLMDEVLEIAGDRIRLKNITVRREYALEDKQILADKNRIRMALTNIVINAIDAMSSENGELRLTESLVDGHYSLQIADNGCGIPAEHLQQIFDPYFTRKPGGLGLGLSTTREILHEYHIGMNVESSEGEGTCFTLSFDQKHVSLLA
jgi:signal transduction histidine kinase